MSFTFTQEQALLKDSVGSYLRDKYPFEERQRIVKSEAGYSSSHWKNMSDLGLMGAPFPEYLGGYGGGIYAGVATMIEFGRSLVVEPYLATVSFAGGLICAGNNEEFKASIIPEVVAGTQILAFAHEERGTRGNSLNIALTAEKKGDNFILNGEKLGVHAALIADKWVVTCRTSGKVGDEQGLSILLVDALAEGIVRTDFTNIDGFKSANVQFNNVCVSSSNLLSAQGEAASVLNEAFKSAITLLCAEAVGAMEVLLDATVQYSKDREQFDKPIGSFQSLKHSIVDMFIALESSSAVLMGTAALVEVGSCTDRDISILKAQIGEAGRYIGQQAVQVHGGMGMTDEVTIGYYLKRLLAIDAIFGNTDYHLRVLGAGQ